MSTALVKQENIIPIKEKSSKKKISPFLQKLYTILEVSLYRYNIIYKLNNLGS
jgi:hypothetical protein